MTQEDKQLLLVDLCARLPYGVKCKHKFSDYKEVLNGIRYENAFCYFTDCEPCLIEDIKPYLFPLSSMTEEQKEEYCQLQQKIIYNSKGLVNTDIMNYINWCYENHLDVNGLIPLDLAIDCTNLNIY